MAARKAVAKKRPPKEEGEENNDGQSLYLYPGNVYVFDETDFKKEFDALAVLFSETGGLFYISRTTKMMHPVVFSGAAKTILSTV